MVSWDYYMDHYAMPANTEAPAPYVPQCDWPFYAARADEQLARFKRMYTVTIPTDLVDKPDASGVPYAEAMAVCAMAEALANFDAIQNGNGGPVSSASIGSVSVSYGNLAVSSLDVSPKGQAKELYRCASKYLDIYRGVGRW